MSEWQEYKLSEITDYINRGVTPSYSEDGVIVINQKCIRDGIVKYEQSRFTDCIKKKIPIEKYLKSYDILINSTGQGTLGRVAQVKEIIEATTVDSHVTIVRANKKINPIYLGYYLKSKQDFIESLAEGTTGQTELSRYKVADIVIKAPSSKKQTIIAETLSSLDDKIELNNKINKNLEELAQSLFKQWFIDFEFPNKKNRPYKSSGGKFIESELGKIPEDWKVSKLSQLIDIIGGGTPKRTIDEYWNGNIPWFSIRDIPQTSQFLITDATEKITELGLKKSSTKILPKGTTIITARGTVGKLALLGEPMAMNQSCYGIKGRNGIGPFFNYFNLKQTISTLKQNTHGAVFDTITTSTFETALVAFGNLELVLKFDEVVKDLIGKVEINVRENINLVDLRNTLLFQLIQSN
jgi:type I restriction enzyme S subunit